MPIEAVLVSVIAWALAALTILGTQYASLRLKRAFPEQKRAVVWAMVLGLAWLMITGFVGASGVLANFSQVPPPFLIFMTLCWATTAVVAMSPIGRFWVRGLPFWVLIGFQSFRILVEIFLYLGFQSGFVPEQVTFEGMNFDILTGITAIPMAWWASRGAPWQAVAAWNAVGLALLLTVVTVAILSAPLPFRVFPGDPSSEFVTRFPYVWLPAVLVQYAFLGHLLCFRKLWDNSVE